MSDKIAILGCGNWGSNLVRDFCDLVGPEHVVVYDELPARSRALAVRFRGLMAADARDEVWNDESISAVAIATPTISHAALARDALNAGKHVFVEKPLTTSSADAAELCILAEQRRRVLMVDHLLLYHPVVQEMEQRIATGELGDILYLYSQRLNLGVVRSEENVLWSLGPHDVAVALRLLGASPTQVSAQGGIYLQPHLGIQDVAFLTLVFQRGEMANLHLSWLDPDKIRKITVVGSRKMAVFDDMEPRAKLRIYDKGVTMVSGDRSPQVRHGDVTFPNVPLQEPLKVACAHFLSCISQGVPCQSDGRAGLEVVRVLEAAQASLDLGGELVEVSQTVG